MSASPDLAKLIVSDYLVHHFSLFASNLEKSKTDPDQDAIHQYRVSVKRIRAIFRAVNKLYPENILPNELLEPLREIFKAGGPIRDEQVQLDIVRKMEVVNSTSFPLITQHFENKIKHNFEEYRVRSKFFDEIFPEDFTVTVVNCLSDLEDNGLHAKLSSWMLHSLEKLNERKHKIDNPKKLHRFRTRLKQLFYVVEMIYYSNLQPAIDDKTFEDLKAFGQQLGDWHDLYQLWSLTGEFLRSTRSPQLLDEAFRLKKMISPIHDVHFNDIYEKLKKEDLLVIKYK